MVKELNDIIRKIMRNKPRTQKNLKKVGYIEEELKLPDRREAINEFTIDQIKAVHSVIGHDESINDMYLKYLDFGSDKIERLTREIDRLRGTDSKDTAISDFFQEQNNKIIGKHMINKSKLNKLKV